MAVFAKFDGIDGEVIDRDHDGWIELTSLSYGVRRPDGKPKGRPEFDEVVCTKELDKASPLLMLAVATGQVFRKVVIEYIDDDDDGDGIGTERRRASVTCGDVVCTRSAVTETSGDGEGPRETISLNFEKIEWSYTPARGKGSSDSKVTAGWNVEKGRRV